MIESVPNVSEGRRASIMDEIAATVQRTRGVALLDASGDPSHNRSVFTMAGEARPVSEAIVALTAIAVARIDLRQHRGAHPRIGAVDVIPFIPLDGSTMADCVALAREVGRAIAERFGMPVFLYEEAATRPERRRLEHIRAGQFEGLAAKMRQAEWAPDFGPTTPHPSAGATVVGARQPLIAFNINLDSDRVDIARQIARAVRESSGGLPCVKALGLELAHRGTAQVSMNLTNFARTSIQEVFDAVTREARARGVGVLESELIGLVPAAAMRDTSPEHLRLTGFTSEQILEERLRERTSNW